MTCHLNSSSCFPQSHINKIFQKRYSWPSETMTTRSWYDGTTLWFPELWKFYSVLWFQTDKQVRSNTIKLLCHPQSAFCKPKHPLFELIRFTDDDRQGFGVLETLHQFPTYTCCLKWVSRRYVHSYSGWIVQSSGKSIRNFVATQLVNDNVPFRFWYYMTEFFCLFWEFLLCQWFYFGCILYILVVFFVLFIFFQYFL